MGKMTNTLTELDMIRVLSWNQIPALTLLQPTHLAQIVSLQFPSNACFKDFQDFTGIHLDSRSHLIHPYSTEACPFTKIPIPSTPGHSPRRVWPCGVHHCRRLQ